SRLSSLPVISRVLLPSLFLNDTATTEIYTLSLHDALPIWSGACIRGLRGLPCGRRDGCSRWSPPCCQPPGHAAPNGATVAQDQRSEEHTSELQSRENLVCRLLLEKKKKKQKKTKSDKRRQK